MTVAGIFTNTDILSTILAAGLAVVVKIVQSWLGKKNLKKENESERFRKELRQELLRLSIENSNLRQDNDELREEVDEWKEKYWKVQNKGFKKYSRIHDLEMELERKKLQQQISSSFYKKDNFSGSLPG